MIKLNVYSIKYVYQNKEQSIDIIATTPTIACQNFARWIDSRYYRGADAKIVELSLISEGAIYYKTDKPRR